MSVGVSSRSLQPFSNQLFFDKIKVRPRFLFGQPVWRAYRCDNQFAVGMARRRKNVANFWECESHGQVGFNMWANRLSGIRRQTGGNVYCNNFEVVFFPKVLKVRDERRDSAFDRARQSGAEDRINHEIWLSKQTSFDIFSHSGRPM